MKNTKVNIFDKQKAHVLPTGTRLLVRRACNATLQFEKFEGRVEIDVTFVDDKKIKEMNKAYRNIDSSTDVLSFPLGENGVYDINPETQAFQLGDIVISTEHAFSQADLYGHSIQREIAFLTVHSMLHLLGYDHENHGIEETLMFEKQEEILTELGLGIVK
ncbi:MAG: rRNA maturation RNase YbeY [Acutalibacteraceae bacterium]|nr:rRNA maturation RNase YbeY [Acutalibacteraceae bacterium]